MGWDYLYKDPKMTVPDFFKQEFPNCIDCAVVGRTAYLAIRDGSDVFAMICLFNRAKDPQFNFGYKAMYESMGPYERQCPQRILAALTPTTHPNAVEWRLDCWAKIQKTANRIVPTVGMVLKFPQGLFSSLGKISMVQVTGIEKNCVYVMTGLGGEFRLPKKWLDDAEIVILPETEEIGDDLLPAID